MKLEEAEK